MDQNCTHFDFINKLETSHNDVILSYRYIWQRQMMTCMYLNTRNLCLLLMACCLGYGLYGQKVQKDSVYLFSLLDKADEYDFAGEIDSAKRVVELVLSKTSDSHQKHARAYAYLKKADLQLKENGGQQAVKALCEKGLQLGKGVNDAFIIGLAHHQLSQYYRENTAYEEAIAELKLAAEYYDEERFPDYKGLVYNDIGHIYSRLGEFESSFEYFLKAIAVFEKSGFDKEIANTLGNIAIVHYRMGDRPKAIEMFKKSATIREKIEDVKGLATIYGNLSTAYQPISLDSAIVYQIKAVENANKAGVLSIIAQTNMNTALILAKQGKTQDAISYEIVAIEKYQQLGDLIKSANRELSVASLSLKLQNFAQAEQYLNKVEAALPQLKNKLLNESFHQTKTAYYKAINKYDLALQHSELSFAWKDSISSDKNKQFIADLETKYETEKKSNEILRLQAETKLSDLELTNQKNLLLKNRLQSQLQEDAILILNKENEISQAQVLFEKQAANQLEDEFDFRRKIFENEKTIDSQTIREQKATQYGLISTLLLLGLLSWLGFSRYQLRQKVKEQEKLLAIRNHLSKELHDEVGSTITSIQLLSKAGNQASVRANDGKTEEILSRIEHQSKTIQNHLSDIVWALKPDNHNVGSIIARIREQSAMLLEPAGIKLHIRDSNLFTQAFNEVMLKEILLITKEAIHNIVKHSGAKNVYIGWNPPTKNAGMEFYIKDDGIWKAKSDHVGSGSGLKNMESRAAKMGTMFSILRSDSGTTITIKWPHASS